MKRPRRTCAFRCDGSTIFFLTGCQAAMFSGCPFKELGVQSSATSKEVQKAYRDLAIKHHPDVGGCEKKFRQVNEAYEECKVRMESGAAAAGGTTPEASSASTRSTPSSRAKPSTAASSTGSKDSGQRASRNPWERASQRPHQQEPHEARPSGGAEFRSQRPNSYEEWHEWMAGDDGSGAQRRYRSSHSGEAASGFNAGSGNGGGEFDDARHHAGGMGFGPFPGARGFAGFEEVFEEARRREQDAWEAFRAQQRTSRASVSEQRRQECLERIRKESDAHALVSLMREAISGGLFVKDPGQPLMGVLRRLHFGMKLGYDHVDKCVEVIELWEELVELRASNNFFHEILHIYTDYANANIVGATIASEVVQRVIDLMSARGLEIDDWTMTLANKVFRSSPYPSW